MKFFNLDKTEHIDLSIPDKFDKIGINLSGGMDSTLLLYLLGFVLRKKTGIKLIAVTAKNLNKDIRAPERVNVIIDKIHQMHGVEFVNEHAIHYIREDADRCAPIKEMFDQHRINLMIGGVTRNPISEAPVIVKNSSGVDVDLSVGALPGRSIPNRRNWLMSVDGVISRVDENGLRPNNFFCPLNRVDKSFVAELYKKYKLLDTLLPLTRSCEGMAPSTNNFTVECGDCWWCLERKWGLNSLR